MVNNMQQAVETKCRVTVQFYGGISAAATCTGKTVAGLQDALIRRNRRNGPGSRWQGTGYSFIADSDLIQGTGSHLRSWRAGTNQLGYKHASPGAHLGLGHSYDAGVHYAGAGHQSRQPRPLNVPLIDYHYYRHWHASSPRFSRGIQASWKLGPRRNSGVEKNE